MAKTKEASTPLIFALVFFVLTTIAFGVMWYLSFSETETHVAAKKKAETDLASLRTSKDEAERVARVYRIYLGVPEAEDVNTIDTESKAGDKIAAEVKKVNDALAAKIATSAEKEKEDAKEFVEKKMPAMTDKELKEYITAEKQQEGFVKLLTFWTVDGNNKATKAPTEGLIDQFAKLKIKDSAYKAAEESRASFKAQIESIKLDVAALKKMTETFKTETGKIPADVQAKVAAALEGLDKRIKQFNDDQAASNKTLGEVKEERDRYERELRKVKGQLDERTAEYQRLVQESAKKDTEAFNYDEPQGKILRKLPEGVVEIGLGSANGVRPGLTFTVLPTDFPEKGRQSRVRMIRQPDGKGGYKSVETFVPKGSIEVYEVVNERLSLARIQAGSELDPIRDGVAQGDLIYNSVWRKGVADHIALIGIFDVNGDGIDDIESVVRDLTKMGIPVDAYFDMKKKAWVGTVTERTRYVVEGNHPQNSPGDPNFEEKNKLLGAKDKAIADAKLKGVNTVNYRDFFSRMGYKFRLDVADDKINQAATPYLSGAGGGAMPPSPPNP